MKYQYFIASAWRNRDQVLELTKKLRMKNKTVYSFLEAPHAKERVDINPEEHMKMVEKMDIQKDPYIKAAFDNDMNGEKNSECLILLLPAGKSAHIEAGVAYGLGKKCILIGKPDVSDSLYLIFEEIYPDIESFINYL